MREKGWEERGPKACLVLFSGLSTQGVIPMKWINSGLPRFGSVAVWGWNGSSGSGFRFQRFLRGVLFQHSLTERDGSGSGSCKTAPAVPVPCSVAGKTV